MRRHVALLASLLALALAPGDRLGAQGSSFVPLDDVAYSYIDALMARGALRELTALERPYTAAALRQALSAEAAPTGRVAGSWWRALSEALSRHEHGGAATTESRFRASVGVALTAGAWSSGQRELMLADDSSGAAPGGAVRLLMTAGPLTAVARMVVDNRLREDAEFTGKKDRAIAGRMEDAYIAGQWRYGELFFGRQARNWGPAALVGLQLGDHAYSYDHLHARLGVERLSLSTVVAQLDDARLTPDSLARRWFAIHRLRGRWRDLEIAASEAVVYGGVNRGLDLALANPLGMYDLAQYNERREGNISYALDVSWRPRALGVLSAQWMLDDVQVDDCQPNCAEPPSWGASLTMEGIPLVADHRLFGSYARVTNLTYRTPQPWETWSVAGTGLGHARADYDEARVGLDLALIPRATLRLYGARRRQGEGDFRVPFPAPADYATTDGFLTGTIATTTRAGASVAAAWRNASASADIGYNRSANAGHVAGRATSGIEARVRVAVEWSRLVAEDRAP